MSQQYTQFEDEPRGEPSVQMGSAPRYELPQLSSDHTDLPDQRLQAKSPGTAQSIPYNNARFVLALMSLIFVFVLGIIVATSKTANIANFVFAVLFAGLVLLLNFIFAFRGNASPWGVREPKD